MCSQSNMLSDGCVNKNIGMCTMSVLHILRVLGERTSVRARARAFACVHARDACDLRSCVCLPEDIQLVWHP